MTGHLPIRARETVLATLWIVLLAIAATAPALFGSRSLGTGFLLDDDSLYATSDAPSAPAVLDGTLAYQDLPRDFAAADGLHHGRIDLWNPRVGLGMPLWGDGGGFFFPAKIPFYVVPSQRSYDITAALRLVIGGLGSFLLARRRGLDLVPALAAASLFALSGSLMGTLQLGVMAAACMLPWVLLGAEVLARRRSLAASAATGLALAITASSGHPMLVVAVFVGFGAAVAGHVLAALRRPRAALMIGGLATMAVVLGLAVAAPAVFPVLEAEDAGRLYKGTGTYKLQHAWYRSQIREFLPISLFAPATLNALRGPLSVGFPYAFLTPTVGLFGLVFAVAGILRRGLDAALLCVLLVGLGLTLSPPVLGAIGRLPLVEYVYPMYAWSLVALPLTQAAGRGVATLQEGWNVLAALVILFAGASSLMFLNDVFPGSFLEVPVRKVFLMQLEDRVGWLRVAFPLVVIPLIVVALVAGARGRLANRCAIAATAFAALELASCVAPATWFPSSTVLQSRPSPAVRFLQKRLGEGQYRMLASPRTIGTPATPSLFGLADARGLAAMPVERYVRYLEAISPAAQWYVWQFPGDVIRHPLLDLAAVRYIVRPRLSAGAPPPLLEGDAVVRLAYRDDRVAIYENDAAVPRARIVHDAVYVRDREEAFASLVESAKSHTHADAAGLVDRVFIEPSADGPFPEGAAVEALPGPEQVGILPSNDPDRVELQASLVAPGWVVLADTFYPGWTATVDGVPAPIHPTNIVFRGVFVPSGTHRVEFRYAPPVFGGALALAAVGLGVIGFLLVRARRSGSPNGKRGTAGACRDDLPAESETTRDDGAD
jgi:hypothetical protein